MRLPCGGGPKLLTCNRPCAPHVTSAGSSVHQAPIALTCRESVVLMREGVCLTHECAEIIAVGRGAEARLLLERKGRRIRWSQDSRGILGTLAEPTGTDEFRLLCHQFVPSSLSLLASCISRCKTCWLKMKPLKPVLLRWVANGGQGQNARHRAFPLPTGRWSFIGWWRPTNHFVGLHRSMGSPMKRSVAFFFMRSRLESKMRTDRQAGRRPWEQQALLLVSMQGSDCSPAQAAAVVPSPLFAQFRKPSACHPKRWLAPRSGRLPGNSFQRSNGLLLQQVLLEAGGGRLSCLLSLPLAFVPPGCAGTQRGESVVSLHMQAAQDEPGRCRRNAHGKPLLWGRQPGRKRTRTRWEAGPIVPGAKALCLHMQTRKEVVLACGRKLCLEGESPPLLFKPGDSS